MMRMTCPIIHANQSITFSDDHSALANTVKSGFNECCRTFRYGTLQVICTFIQFVLVFTTSNGGFTVFGVVNQAF